MPEPQFDFPRTIDSTMRSDFVSCPHRFFRAYIENRRQKGSSIHLHFGGAIAKALHVFRHDFYSGELVPERIEASLMKATVALIEFWGDFEGPPEHNKNLSSAIETLHSYFQQYPPLEDRIRPYMTDAGPATEFTFALPIPGIYHPQTNEPLLYSGSFDMLAQSTQGDGIFVDDEKTATQLGQSWLNNWKLRSQMTGYVWGAKQYGFPVSGVVIRGMAPLKKYINHLEAIEDRPQWMIDRWLTQLQRDVTRMLECYRSNYYDFNLDHACSEYGGCSYLTLCTSPNPERWYDEYETRIWDPLNPT